MPVEDKRSYAKESTKTKPSGVRFDIEKLAFVKSREKLQTNQKVVDFLLNKYWWEFKMPHVTAKEAPPLTLKQESPIPPPLKIQAAIQPVNVAALMAKYWEDKRECQTTEDWNDVLKRLMADDRLSTRQKELIKNTNQ